MSDDTTPPESTGPEPTPPATPPPPAATPWGSTSYNGGQAPPPPPPPPPADGPTFSSNNMPFDATAAITWGWRKFTAEIGPWLIAALIFAGVTAVITVLSTILTPSTYSTSFVNASRMIEWGFQFVTSVVGWVLTAAAYRGALDVTEGRKFDYIAAFGRIDIAKVLIASLLTLIFTVIGIVLCIIPGIVFVFLSYFTMMFVVDKGLEPMEAIKASIDLVKNNVGPCLLLAVLSIAVIIAGTLACCVGLIAAYPVVALASAYAYKRLQNQPVAD